MRDSQPKIIVIGSVDSALEKFSSKLRDAGYTRVLHQPIAKASIRKTDGIQIAIFLPRLSKDSRNEVAQRLRKTNSALKIVMLYDHTISGTEVADAVINANCEPEDLVRVITYLTRKGSQGAALGA